ncbi:uncharacterized protein TNCV_4086051 [Trichonephila clavipes]|nr:uncharacterized protein TNCV_4086051 [Trichonephila clavipes]
MIRISAQTHITRACGATSKRYLRHEDFDDFKFGNCVFLVAFTNHCMQEGTTDRRGRSHPPQCPISREDRQIVHMAVKDCSVTSRNAAEHIKSVTHHSVSARTIRRRLQQSGLSARRPLLGLHLT